MSQKTKIVATMHTSWPLPTRKPTVLRVESVKHRNKATLSLNLVVEENASQAGRRISHEIPAMLALGSPLAAFLAGAFGIKLTPGESFDLETLVGRRFLASFSIPAPDGSQQMIGFKPVTTTGANSSPQKKES